MTETEREVFKLVKSLLQPIGEAPPEYGEVAITFLAGKPHKIEKRQTFRP